MFEMILNSGSKTTTYKFGLLSGIVDYVIDNPLEPSTNNFHFIPIFYLAKQFLAYYYPLILEGIRQGPKVKGKTTSKIKEFINEYIESEKSKKEKILPLDVDHVNLLISHIEDSEILSKELIELLFQIRKRIIHQPLQYIRNVKGKQISLFGLLSDEIPFQSRFDEHREIGYKLGKTNIKTAKNWNDLLTIENLQLFFAHQTFQEISKIRFWLRDVLIKRWAQECGEKFESIHPNILALFDLWKKTPKRDAVKIEKYRKLYLENGLKMCIYCNQFVEKDLQIDHLFPWSRFPINSFWNLYPACTSCNSKKSDRIPKINKKLSNQIKKHVQTCLDLSTNQKKIINKDLENLYRIRFKTEWKNNTTAQRVEEILEYIHSLSLDFHEVLPDYEFEIK